MFHEKRESPSKNIGEACKRYENAVLKDRKVHERVIITSVFIKILPGFNKITAGFDKMATGLYLFRRGSLQDSSLPRHLGIKITKSEFVAHRGYYPLCSAFSRWTPLLLWPHLPRSCHPFWWPDRSYVCRNVRCGRCSSDTPLASHPPPWWSS